MPEEKLIFIQDHLNCTEPILISPALFPESVSMFTNGNIDVFGIGIDKDYSKLRDYMKFDIL
jgi:hypothetical protein